MYVKAIALAYKDLQVNPKDSTTLAMVALYHAKTGNAASASEFIRKARAVDPGNAAISYYEAVVHALAGRQQAAMTSLERALKGGYFRERGCRRPRAPIAQQVRGLRSTAAALSSSTRVGVEALSPEPPPSARDDHAGPSQGAAGWRVPVQLVESIVTTAVAPSGNPARSIPKSPPKQPSTPQNCGGTPPPPKWAAKANVPSAGDLSGKNPLVSCSVSWSCPRG